MKTCYYCGGEFEPRDLRPYGPNGEDICFPCGQLPENAETTEAQFKAARAARGQDPDS